jgi:SnoaL-like polyketide cyclase
VTAVDPADTRLEHRPVTNDDAVKFFAEQQDEWNTSDADAEFMGLPGSGRAFDIEGVRVFEMKDGLIDFERRYYDFTGLLIQLGVLRGKPAR